MTDKERADALRDRWLQSESERVSITKMAKAWERNSYGWEAEYIKEATAARKAEAEVARLNKIISELKVNKCQ